MDRLEFEENNEDSDDRFVLHSLWLHYVNHNELEEQFRHYHTRKHCGRATRWLFYAYFIFNIGHIALVEVRSSLGVSLQVYSPVILAATFVVICLLKCCLETLVKANRWQIVLVTYWIVVFICVLQEQYVLNAQNAQFYTMKGNESAIRSLLSLYFEIRYVTTNIQGVYHHPTLPRCRRRHCRTSAIFCYVCCCFMLFLIQYRYLCLASLHHIYLWPTFPVLRATWHRLYLC